jgi:hypothetical protein
MINKSHAGIKDFSRHTNQRPMIFLYIKRESEPIAKDDKDQYPSCLWTLLESSRGARHTDTAIRAEENRIRKTEMISDIVVLI